MADAAADAEQDRQEHHAAELQQGENLGDKHAVSAP
jgi:hypothetical protein